MEIKLFIFSIHISNELMLIHEDGFVISRNKIQTYRGEIKRKSTFYCRREGRRKRERKHFSYVRT